MEGVPVGDPLAGDGEMEIDQQPDERADEDQPAGVARYICACSRSPSATVSCSRTPSP